MILGEKVAIFEWEWGQYLTPRDGQKSPSMVKVLWSAFLNMQQTL